MLFQMTTMHTKNVTEEASMCKQYPFQTDSYGCANCTMCAKTQVKEFAGYKTYVKCTHPLAPVNSPVPEDQALTSKPVWCPLISNLGRLSCQTKY